jgi:hypothetical protein
MLRRTFKTLGVGSVLAAFATLAGCSADAGFNPVGKSSEEMTPTQLAAYAATSKYPTEAQPSSDLRAAAIVNRDKGTIKIYNFSDRPIHAARVWVNKAFVAKIDGIAPQQKVTISTDKMYGPFGNTFADQKDTPIGTVQLQTDEGLFNLQGPAQE